MDMLTCVGMFMITVLLLIKKTRKMLPLNANATKITRKGKRYACIAYS